MPLRPFRLFLPPNYPSATPTFDVSREWNTGNIGIVSKCLGLNAGFRKKIIQLFDLGYASRLRLIFCISAGFVLCHIFISYVPTVSLYFDCGLQIDYIVDFSWNCLIVVWKYFDEFIRENVTYRIHSVEKYSKTLSQFFEKKMQIFRQIEANLILMSFY